MTKPELPERAKRNEPMPRPVEAAREQSGVNQVGQWGAGQVGERVKGYAIDKSLQYAARTALGRGVLSFLYWVWIVEWGALAIGVLLAILGIISIIQEETFLGIVVLMLAALAAGVGFGIRWVRHFIERQIARAWLKFQELVAQGVVKMSDWPSWYRRNRSKV
jgi:hypothetical protein